MERRSYLKGLGAALAGGFIVGGVALNQSDGGTGPRQTPRNEPTPDGATTSAEQTASTTEESDPSRTRHGIQFSNVVDAVDDIGLDPTGNEPVDGLIAPFLTNDTLLEFQSGTYLFARRHTVDRAVNFGISGVADSRDDVEFVAPEGDVQTIFNIRSGRNVLIENLTFNQRDTPEGAIGNNIRVEDNLQLHNLRHRGFEPDQDTGTRTFLNPAILDPDGTGHISDYDMRMSGFEQAAYPGNAGAMYAGPGHEGELVLDNIRAKNTSGFYMSRAPGPIKFRNSHFETINRYALRLGGEGSEIRNSTIVIDAANADANYGFNYAVRWESGYQGFSGGLIENCEFVCRSVDEQAVPLIEHEADVGTLTIRDTDLRYEVDGDKPIVRSRRPGASDSIDGTPDRPWALELDGVSITGTSAGDAPVVSIVGRHDSSIRNCCVNVDGAGRDGICIVDATACEISDTNIKVDGQATSFHDASVATSNITHTNSCGTQP